MKNQKNQIVHVINICILIVSAIIVNYLFCYKQYTLHENGKWESTKTQMQKGLMGAWTAMYTKVTLRQNHLDIGAWNGYQEFTLKQTLKFNSINFYVRSSGYPFSFILNKSMSGSTGIYFDYPTDRCFFFVTDSEGKFIKINQFYINHSLDSINWNKIECSLQSKVLRVSINDLEYYKIQTDLPDSMHIGFRGSNNNVYIDDIKMTTSENKNILIDDFSPPIALKWQALLFMILVLVMYYKLSGNYAPNLTLLNLVILFGIVTYFLIYFWRLSSLYAVDDFKPTYEGVSSKIDNASEVCRKINEEFPVSAVAGKKPIILFIGSSQTWGAGATEISKTYPERVHQQLTKYFGDSSITCINTGIPGMSSDKLLEFYKSEWIKYQPILTIIDLSNNDPDTATFRKSIKAFIEINKRRSIKTLLVLEPNDSVLLTLFWNHRTMRDESIKTDVPYIDMQRYIAAYSDSGLLWWDNVHLTDYGYHVFSDGLSPAVIKILESDSAVYRQPRCRHS